MEQKVKKISLIVLGMDTSNTLSMPWHRKILQATVLTTLLVMPQANMHDWAMRYLNAGYTPAETDRKIHYMLTKKSSYPRVGAATFLLSQPGREVAYMKGPTDTSTLHWKNLDNYWQKGKQQFSSKGL